MIRHFYSSLDVYQLAQTGHGSHADGGRRGLEGVKIERALLPRRELGYKRSSTSGARVEMPYVTRTRASRSRLAALNECS